MGVQFIGHSRVRATAIPAAARWRVGADGRKACADRGWGEAAIEERGALAVVYRLDLCFERTEGTRTEECFCSYGAFADANERMQAALGRRLFCRVPESNVGFHEGVMVGRDVNFALGDWRAYRELLERREAAGAGDGSRELELARAMVRVLEAADDDGILCIV